MSIFQVKSVDEIMAESHERGHKLPRVLGSFDVTMIGIGAIIGAGIFAMLGEAAVKGGAGPSLIISIIVTAIACGFSALCYAELAAMVPISGSAYTYAYATMGELAAWIIGWDLILEYAIGNVAVAISWSGYFNDFLRSVFGFGVPLWLRMDYHTFLKTGADISAVPHLFGFPIICNLLAVSVVAALTWVLVLGIKESTRFNSLMVGIKLLVLAIFVCVGIYYFDPKNWVPFAPGGWKGIQVGAAYIFFAYIGFDAVSTVAEETRDPQKNMPIGIIGSLVICTFIYILVTVALTGMMPFTEMKDKIAEPLVAGLQYNHAAHWLVGLVSLGAVVATTAVLLVFQMGQPRIFFSMSRDGLLPSYFARVHPKYKTPHVTTIWTGIFVAGFASFFSLDVMAELCNIGTLFAFVVVCAGVIILRVKDPDRPRSFRAPGGYATPVLGIGFCLFLMLGLGFMTWMRFLIWLIAGLAIYFFYGYKNSRLRTGEPAIAPEKSE
ncbi:MAG: amino acid permease [Elusimicrobiales bacterium]|jgi:APA family basic amino acid/polyamine antiporter